MYNNNVRIKIIISIITYAPSIKAHLELSMLVGLEDTHFTQGIVESLEVGLYISSCITECSTLKLTTLSEGFASFDKG